MKYNIFTVCNDAYFPFLDIFINSINKNSSKVNKIFVVDTGLKENFSKYISSLDKVSLIKIEKSLEFSGVHTDGWYDTTSKKTKSLLNLFNSKEYGKDIPTILLDNDVFVAKELSDLIDLNYDIQVTTMEKQNQHTRSDGIRLTEIACMVIFNNIEKSKSFIINWILCMDELKKHNIHKPHETPAFNIILNAKKHENIILNDHPKNLKVKYMREYIVCSDMELYDDTYSIHFKSNGKNNLSKKENFIDRISKWKNFSKPINVIDFLNKEQFKKWSV